MTKAYVLTATDIVVRVVDGASIPSGPANRDRAEYEDWLAGGNTPDPYVPPVPASATKLGLKRAFDELGAWDQVKAAIATDPDAQEEWDLALEIRRSDKLVQELIAALQLSSDQVDHIIIRANELV